MDSSEGRKESGESGSGEGEEDEEEDGGWGEEEGDESNAPSDCYPFKNTGSLPAVGQSTVSALRTFLRSRSVSSAPSTSQAESGYGEESTTDMPASSSTQNESPVKSSDTGKQNPSEQLRSGAVQGKLRLKTERISPLEEKAPTTPHIPYPVSLLVSASEQMQTGGDTSVTSVAKTVPSTNNPVVPGKSRDASVVISQGKSEVLVVSSGDEESGKEPKGETKRSFGSGISTLLRAASIGYDPSVYKPDTIHSARNPVGSPLVASSDDRNSRPGGARIPKFSRSNSVISVSSDSGEAVIAAPMKPMNLAKRPQQLALKMVTPKNEPGTPPVIFKGVPFRTPTGTPTLTPTGGTPLGTPSTPGGDTAYDKGYRDCLAFFKRKQEQARIEQAKIEQARLEQAKQLQKEKENTSAYKEGYLACLNFFKSRGLTKSLPGSPATPPILPRGAVPLLRSPGLLHSPLRQSPMGPSPLIQSASLRSTGHSAIPSPVIEKQKEILSDIRVKTEPSLVTPHQQIELGGPVSPALASPSLASPSLASPLPGPSLISPLPGPVMASSSYGSRVHSSSALGSPAVPSPSSSGLPRDVVSGKPLRLAGLRKASDALPGPHSAAVVRSSTYIPTRAPELPSPDPRALGGLEMLFTAAKQRAEEEERMKSALAGQRSSSTRESHDIQNAPVDLSGDSSLDSSHLVIKDEASDSEVRLKSYSCITNIYF